MADLEPITREEKIMSGENLTPITRKELFLAKAAGQVVETPMPITREEMFLDKIQGGSVLPSQQKTIDITENGTVEVTPDYGYTLSKVTANVNVEGNSEVFVATSDVEIFVVVAEDVFTLQDAFVALGGNGNVAIQIVQTLPEKLILSNRDVSIYVYVVESTGIGYVNFGYDSIITVGQAIMMGNDGYDKGWTTDINSVTEDGIYCVRKSSGGGENYSHSAVTVIDDEGNGPFDVTYKTVKNGTLVNKTKTIDSGMDVRMVVAIGTEIFINQQRNCYARDENWAIIQPEVRHADGGTYITIPDTEFCSIGITS